MSADQKLGPGLVPRSVEGLPVAAQALPPPVVRPVPEGAKVPFHSPTAEDPEEPGRDRRPLKCVHLENTFTLRTPQGSVPGGGDLGQEGTTPTVGGARRRTNYLSHTSEDRTPSSRPRPNPKTYKD